MKILVMTGSPHKDGTSALLADKFIEGAKEAGHEIYRFDAGFKNIHPCTACYTCQNTDNGCVFKDDEQELYPQVLAADAVVFVAPISYYGMCAQLKLARDRFFALGDTLKSAKKWLKNPLKTALRLKNSEKWLKLKVQLRISQ